MKYALAFFYVVFGLLAGALFLFAAIKATAYLGTTPERACAWVAIYTLGLMAYGWLCDVFTDWMRARTRRRLQENLGDWLR